MHKKIIEELINKYYPKNRPVRNILITHSSLVRDKALSIAQRHPELQADENILEAGAMLHDIGIILTHAPKIDCYGNNPYIKHGILGSKILKDNGLDKLALIAERHTGAGISSKEIIKQNLPLPIKDMLAVSVEEKIIAFADKFYSKGKNLTYEKTVSEIRKEMENYEKQQLLRFKDWCEKFC